MSLPGIRLLQFTSSRFASLSTILSSPSNLSLVFQMISSFQICYKNFLYISHFSYLNQTSHLSFLIWHPDIWLPYLSSNGCMKFSVMKYNNFRQERYRTNIYHMHFSGNLYASVVLIFIHWGYKFISSLALSYWNVDFEISNRTTYVNILYTNLINVYSSPLFLYSIKHKSRRKFFQCKFEFFVQLFFLKILIVFYINSKWNNFHGEKLDLQKKLLA
jgi:hypothetical protein